VEYPCHQCHATVQEGMAFCPQCNAPQIRVAVADVGPSSRTPDFETPHQEVLQGIVSAGSSAGPGIEWVRAFPAMALAGLIAAGITLMPFNTFGLGLLAGGVLSVAFYRRRSVMADITPGMGARLGIVSGILGFGMSALVVAIGSSKSHVDEEIRGKMIEAVKQAAARSSDPQAQKVVEFVQTPQGFTLFLSLLVIVIFVSFILFSGLGGALGAALLRRKPRL
jgi:hypothetical protein